MVDGLVVGTIGLMVGNLTDDGLVGLIRLVKLVLRVLNMVVGVGE